jgi:UPF0716 protein FxsA
MRLLFIFAILLAFPVLELWILVELGQEYGWWLLVYLLMMVVLGWRLIHDEKQLVFAKMAQALAAGGTPAKVMFGSAKNFVAGILLILPGILSDILAAILLLLPNSRLDVSTGGSRHKGRAANDDVIEGEFRRED